MTASAAACFVKSVPVGGAFLRCGLDRLVRDDVPHGLDPVNEIAVEWAVSAREAGTLGSLTAVSMAPPGAENALHRAIAMGCDDALVVTDPALDGAPVGVTARVLAAVTRRLGAELALFGNESLDGSSGTVPAAVAALLGWPLVTLAREADLAAGHLVALRDHGRGLERVRAPLPAVVSFSAGAIVPRYPRINELLAARRRPLERTDLAALGLESPSVPAVEHRSRLVEITLPPTSPRCFTSLDAGIDAVAAVLDDLVGARG